MLFPFRRGPLAALTLTVAAACGGSTTGPRPDPDPTPTVKNVTGRIDRTVTVAGQTRTFVVYVGNTVGPTAAAPVVFMFHGSGQSGDQFYNISRWKETADAKGLIAVFPDALTYCYKEDNNDDGDLNDPVDVVVGSKWTAARPTALNEPLCSAAEVAQLPSAQQTLVNHAVSDDLVFIDEMIALLKQKYVIDPKRVYGTGFSNGAQLVDRLAIDRGQTFAALAAHGGASKLAAAPGRALSFAGTLGNKDQHLAKGTGLPEVPIGPNTLTQFPGIKAAYVNPILAQLQLADVSTYAEITLSGKRVGQWTFRTSTAGASNSYTFSLIEDNDHAYPNGIGHPIVLALPLWSFFETQQLP